MGLFSNIQVYCTECVVLGLEHIRRSIHVESTCSMRAHQGLVYVIGLFYRSFFIFVGLFYSVY